MSHPTELTLKTLQFYSTASYPCSYIDGRSARSQVAAPTHLIDSDTYSKLVEKGFRRSGLFTYRPQCDACQACVPIRIDVEHFEASRTQKKIWRRHQYLQATNAPLAFQPEHFELYRRYVSTRHAGAGMDHDDPSQYAQFLLTSRVDTTLIEFRDQDGVLQMVSIIDILESGLSAVYTFFDPATAGSLGTYGVLWQIDRCQAMGLSWLYLGYWIRESRKMAYKTQYQPCEILRSGNWIPL